MTRNARHCKFVVLSLALMSFAIGSGSMATEPTVPTEPGLTPPFYQSDVVVVIDYSALALVASGIDVNKNGVIGRNHRRAIERDPFVSPAKMWTTDFGDTAGALLLHVAQALVERLALRQNRVGLVSLTVRERRQGANVAVRFTDKSEVLVPVGESDAVLAALADFPAPQERMRTDLNRLLERGTELLDDAAANTKAVRPRAILLLSLGQPSAPDGIYYSSQRALDRATALGARGIAVWAIPIRPEENDFLDALTRRSGGSVIPLDQLDAQFGLPSPEGSTPAAQGFEAPSMNAVRTP